MVASRIGSCQPQCAVESPWSWTHDQYVVWTNLAAASASSLSGARSGSGLAVIPGSEAVVGLEYRVIGAVGKVTVVVLGSLGDVITSPRTRVLCRLRANKSVCTMASIVWSG
jgi:hypothetical protein